MIEQHFLAQLVIILGLAVAVSIPLRRLGLPMIIGYMAVGVVVGPHAWGLLPAHETTVLAELGVVLLMFAVGLEFSASRVLRLRRHVFGLGGAQVAMVTLLAGFALRRFGGVDAWSAVVLGGAFAMSSTAIGLKQLSAQAELNSRHGRDVVSMLLFQDLATLLFLVLIAALSRGAEGQQLEFVVGRIGRAAAAFALLLGLGRFALRPIMDRVAAAKSNELFMLTTLLVVVAGAFGAHFAGLSPPLGAFLVGMMLGETRYKHQVEDDIRPFRDVLLGLFFVTIGMRLDPSVLPEYWQPVLLVLVALVVGKATLIVAMLRVFSVETVQAVRTGVALSHGGEFGLLITTLALQSGLIGSEVGQPILAGLILSMVVAPFAIRHNRAIAARLVPAWRPDSDRQRQEKPPRDHVIICGYGSVGRYLASLLDKRSIEYVAVDNDLEHVHAAENAGRPVLFGDAGRITALRAAGLEYARCVVVTFGDAEVSRNVVEHVRSQRSDLPIVVSVEAPEHARMLAEAGATEAIPEGLSASLLLGEHVLRFLGVEEDAVRDAVAELRAELEPAATS